MIGILSDTIGILSDTIGMLSGMIEIVDDIIGITGKIPAVLRTSLTHTYSSNSHFELIVSIVF